jgi:hypothetical protein
MSAQQGDFPDHIGPIRLEVCEVRSFLVPRWWDVRSMFRWYRLLYRVRNDRRKLSEETQAALEWAEEALEREFIYGKEANG